MCNFLNLLIYSIKLILEVFLWQDFLSRQKKKRISVIAMGVKAAVQEKGLPNNSTNYIES